MNIILVGLLLLGAWFFYDEAPFISILLGLSALVTLVAGSGDSDIKPSRHRHQMDRPERSMGGVEKFFENLSSLIAIPFKFLFRLFNIRKKPEPKKDEKKDDHH